MKYSKETTYVFAVCTLMPICGTSGGGEVTFENVTVEGTLVVKTVRIQYQLLHPTPTFPLSFLSFSLSPFLALVFSFLASSLGATY